MFDFPEGCDGFWHSLPCGLPANQGGFFFPAVRGLTAGQRKTLAGGTCGRDGSLKSAQEGSKMAP